MSILIISFIVLVGATKSKQEVRSETNKQEIEFAQEKKNKRLAFQMCLEEIERKRKKLDKQKVQENIVKANVLEIQAKADEKRLAEEPKAKAEEKHSSEENRLKEVEEKKTAQPTNVAKVSEEKSSTAVTTTTKNVSKASAKESAKEPAKKTSTPVVNQTSGFNFNGYHFPLGSFSGGGSVPQETNRVYQWTDKPDHFLIERISPAGRAITSVGIGTKIVINGTTYTVTNMERNIPNNADAVDYLYKHNATITFQTCETTRGANGKSHVRFWYAR